MTFAELTPAEKGRSLYQRDVLGVEPRDSQLQYLEITDPTGMSYIVSAFGGRGMLACRCEDYAEQDTCMHVGAAQEYFEREVLELEELSA